MTSAHTGAVAVAHRASFYDSPGDYTSGLAAFLDEGLAAPAPALIAVPRDRHSLIHTHRLRANGDVLLVDMTDLGANPARIIPAIQEFVDAHPGRFTRFVSEPAWPGRTPAELTEVARHEALVNAAFAGKPVALCCAYRTSLHPAVLADAGCTHTHIQHGRDLRESPSYTGSALAHTIAARPPPPAPADATTVAFGGAGLPAVRHLVEEQSGCAGLTVDQAEDLLLAVNELATNSLRHGGGHGTLRIWHDAGTLICEVSDGGHITDPLAGRRPRPAPGNDGDGLWLVNQLCDLTEQRTGPWGTITRVHVRKRLPPRGLARGLPPGRLTGWGRVPTSRTGRTPPGRGRSGGSTGG